MIIEQGYWNYYMSFRLREHKKMIDSMKKNGLVEGVIGVSEEGEALVNTQFDSYFESRKKDMSSIIDRKTVEKWDRKKEEELYQNNELPEYYFDFHLKENKLVDKLEEAFTQSVEEICAINRAFIQVSQGINEDAWACIALMPLKIEVGVCEYEYCPVFVYLFENGHGAIKVSTEMTNVETELLAHYPMSKWFGDVKAWEPLLDSNEEKKYKIHAHKDNPEEITIITFLLQQFVYELFEGKLIDENMFSCFEVFNIAKMNKKQLWEIDKKASLSDKEAIYHFANPENFMTKMTSEHWYEFWKNEHLNINGIDFIKGHNCRLILGADVESLKEQFHREDIEDMNSYFQISMQRTYDLLIVISLCQKDGELRLYRASEMGTHDIDKQMAIYNQNQNFFERFFDIAPHNARTFHSIVNDINDQSFVDVSSRIDRLKQIDLYQNNLFDKKKTLIIESAALIGTILFGLPMIRETLVILRKTFLPVGDLIYGNVTDNISVGVWVSLIVVMIAYWIHVYKQYRSKRL